MLGDGKMNGNVWRSGDAVQSMAYLLQIVDQQQDWQQQS